MAAERSLLSRLLNWNKKAAPETVDAQEYAAAFAKFQALLLEQYQLRLRAKSAKRLPINLSAKSTDYGTTPEHVESFFGKQTIESKDIFSETGKILQQYERLLLLGEPGAGKTTVLLFAAVYTLQHESEKKLPLILNLATWLEGRDFKEWYAQNISQSYGLSPVFVEELLRRNAVVPFFDGFDEIAEEFRDDCLEQMADYFGDQRSRQLIVSSRKKEYAAAKTDAPVYAEIEVLPLQLEQIKKSLGENAQTQAADRALLNALEQDEYLGKAVETPFYLNTASFLFGKGQRTLADFPFKAGSTEGRQDELVEVFVAEQVPKKQDRKYLSFLARKMEEDNFLVFELVKMQPRWCGNYWKYQILVHLMLLGLPLGVISSMLVSLTDDNLSYGLIQSLSSKVGLSFDSTNLLSWVLLFSALAISVGIDKSVEISTSEVQSWSWKVLEKHWKREVFYAFLIGAFAGAVTGIVGGFMFGILSLIIVSFGFVVLLFRRAGNTISYMLEIPKPYQRFVSTFQHAFWDMFIILLTLGLFGIARAIFIHHWNMEDFEQFFVSYILWYQVLFFTIIFFAIPLLDSQFSYHFSIRLALYLEGKMPLRLVNFLDRMGEQYVFEDNRRTLKGKKQRGATWRFRHKILQDYFAGLAS